MYSLANPCRKARGFTLPTTPDRALRRFSIWTTELGFSGRSAVSEVKTCSLSGYGRTRSHAFSAFKVLGVNNTILDLSPFSTIKPHNAIMSRSSILRLHSPPTLHAISNKNRMTARSRIPPGLPSQLLSSLFTSSNATAFGTEAGSFGSFIRRFDESPLEVVVGLFDHAAMVGLSAVAAYSGNDT